MRRITLVKKIKADGTLCRKCIDILTRLEHDGLMDAIDRTAIADERNPHSEGMRLAAQYRIDQAPFFLVETVGEAVRVFTSYLRLRKELRLLKPNETDQAIELLERNPQLDLI